MSEKTFLSACRVGDLKTVKTLTDISVQCLNQGLKEACREKHIDIMLYLLNHTLADVHDEQDKVFEIACVSGSLNILQLLILDKQIVKTADIARIISDVDKTNDLTFDIVNSLFNKRK